MVGMLCEPMSDEQLESSFKEYQAKYAAQYALCQQCERLMQLGDTPNAKEVARSAAQALWIAAWKPLANTDKWIRWRLCSSFEEVWKKSRIALRDCSFSKGDLMSESWTVAMEYPPDRKDPAKIFSPDQWFYNWSKWRVLWAKKKLIMDCCSNRHPNLALDVAKPTEMPTLNASLAVAWLFQMAAEGDLRAKVLLAQTELKTSEMMKVLRITRRSLQAVKVRASKEIRSIFLERQLRLAEVLNEQARYDAEDVI